MHIGIVLRLIFYHFFQQDAFTFKQITMHSKLALLFSFCNWDIQRLRYKFCLLRVWKTIHPPLWIEILQSLYLTIHSFHIQLFSHTKMVLCHVGKLCFRQFNTACFTFRISMCHFYELFHHIPIKPTSGLKCLKLLSIAS